MLRDELGIPAVGDIRNCIAALADAEPTMSELLQYRFPTTDEDAGNPGLGGHAVGNLLIAAMTDIEGGDFEEGVRHVNRILAVRGQVVPASATPLTLHAELATGASSTGQSQIMRTPRHRPVWLSPADVRPSERRGGGHRRGGPHRPRPGACTRACCRACSSRASATRS